MANVTGTVKTYLYLADTQHYTYQATVNLEHYLITLRVAQITATVSLVDSDD